MKNAFYLLGILLLLNACTSSDLKDKEDCFKVIYPIHYLMPDDSVISLNEDKTKETPIKDWYIQHPEVVEKPSLIYPIEVIWNGELTNVETVEQMIEIKKECYYDKDIKDLKEKDNYNSSDDPIGADYDCPDNKTNIGDSCKTCDGVEGHVNSECECV